MTKKYPTLNLIVRYSGGYTNDYIGFSEYSNCKIKDTRLFPHLETSMTLASFSEANPWFNYQNWKEMCNEWGIELIEDDESVELKYIIITEETYDTLVCGWDNHKGNWQDKCDVCISSNDSNKNRIEP